MAFKLMCLEVHLGLEDDELLLQTLLVEAQEVIFLEVVFESVVVDVVLLLAAAGATVTNVASFVTVTTMCV